jgi:hypothetical protein
MRWKLLAIIESVCPAAAADPTVQDLARKASESFWLESKPQMMSGRAVVVVAMGCSEKAFSDLVVAVKAYA